jgi:hypothetical protein
MTTRTVEFAGYADCLEISNDSTRIVLGPHVGGRLLSYAHDGREALFLDPEQYGWTWDPADEASIDPSGGRCDFGPEGQVCDHPALWLGPWELQERSSHCAEMLSPVDDGCPITLKRRFELDKEGSHVRMTQAIRNNGPQAKNVCHWGRTFGRGGGICVLPLTPDRRYDYIRFDADGIKRNPEDPNIRVRDGFVELLGPAKADKLGLDTKTDWFAYAEPNDLLFLKRYPVDPDGVYGDVEGMTISLYMPDDRLCELEPIGPLTRLEEGREIHFTEDWWLIDFPFPTKGSKIDLEDLKTAVLQRASHNT